MRKLTSWQAYLRLVRIHAEIKDMIERQPANAGMLRGHLRQVKDTLNAAIEDICLEQGTP